MSSGTRARVAVSSRARRAGPAPARSPRPTTPAGSPRCPAWPSCCASRPRPTGGRAGYGGRGTPPPAPIPTDTPATDIRVGYARCSHLTQELQSQLDALEAHGIGREKIFAEKVSTRIRVRPKFEAALADHLTAHGIALEMLAGPLTGTYDPTGTGRILFAFFAAMAETERGSRSNRRGSGGYG